MDIDLNLHPDLRRQYERVASQPSVYNIHVNLQRIVPHQWQSHHNHPFQQGDSLQITLLRTLPFLYLYHERRYNLYHNAGLPHNLQSIRCIRWIYNDEHDGEVPLSSAQTYNQSIQ